MSATKPYRDEAGTTGPAEDVELPAGRSLIASFSRLISASARPTLDKTLALSVISGAVRGISLVLLLPAAVALSTGGAAWGLRLPGWLGVLLVLALAGAIIEYVQAMVGYSVALDLIRTVHRRLGDRLARLPLGWFRDSAAGRLSRLVSKELLSLGEALAHMVATATSLAASAAVMILGSWIWDWRLGVVLTISVPVYALALWAGKRAITRGKRISDPAEEELSDRIVEFARCQGALRSCGRSTEFTPLVEASREASATQRRDLWWGMLANLLHGMAGQMIVVALITVAARLALGGDLGPVEAIAFIGLSLRFMQTLEELGGKVMGIEERRVMIDHVDEILLSPVLPEPSESSPVARPGHVELADVDFSYEPGHQVLHSISLEVPSGSMCALVGPSGCGKTTIAKLVARFYDVDRGVVRVGGDDVRDQRTEDLMAQLSMVFQDVYLFDDTLEANIRVGDPNASGDEVREAARLAGVTEIVERLPRGWETPVGEGGHALSGGERQRVSIARALLKRAPIVLLDEATSALDPENEANVLASMERLRETSTLLVIAHKLETIRTADQIVVLDDTGRIAQRGTHEELVGAPGRYRDFCRAREAAAGWRLA